MQCESKAKSTQTQCRRRAVSGRRTCQVHGGKTPRGIASPHFKTGKYSKDLPSRLAAQYEEARSDPDLLTLRDEIGVAETRFRELLQRLEEGDLGTLWPALGKAKGAYLKAMTADDDKEQAALDTLLDLIDQGQQDYTLWQAIGEQIDRLSRLRTAEHKRQADMEVMISAERANLMIGAIISIMMTAIKKHVEGEHVARSIYADISRGLDAHLNSTTGNLAAPARS